MPHLETHDREQLVGFLDVVQTHARRSVALPLLLSGTVLTVHTKNSLYRIVVEDGSSRRVSVTGGRLFQRSSVAELFGALNDDGSTKVGWIEEGLRLELHTARGPVITSVVESVAVDADATSLTSEEPGEN
jgi:hypothetical protein